MFAFDPSEYFKSAEQSQLYAFGSNSDAQLGVGHNDPDKVFVPTKVSNLPPSHILDVKAGSRHTLLLTNCGELWAVGSNEHCQLASPTIPLMDDVRSALSSTPAFRFLKIANGVAKCAASSTATAWIANHEMGALLYTTGYGRWGELGRGEDVTSTADIRCSSQKSNNGIESTSQVFQFPDNVCDIAAGLEHFVVVLSNGEVWGWGKARHGQLGKKNATKVAIPSKLEDVPFKAERVICGKDFSYIIGAQQEHILLTSHDKFGICSSMPASVKGYKDIGATWGGVVVLFNDGTLVSWGKNDLGQLPPTNLPGLEKMAIGSEHGVGLTAEGKLISWGWGEHGNCGPLQDVDVDERYCFPGKWTEIIEFKGMVALIAAGHATSFVLMATK